MGFSDLGWVGNERWDEDDNQVTEFKLIFLVMCDAERSSVGAGWWDGGGNDMLWDEEG